MATFKRLSEGRIKLRRVRLTFPSLYVPTSMDDDGKKKYQATFILDKKKHKDAIAMLTKDIAKLAKTDLKMNRLPSSKKCLKDGSEKDHLDGFSKKNMFLKATGLKRPLVLDDGEPITEDDGTVYSGCYVDVIIALWAQNNAWGKRVNANLAGVSFADDGESFEAGARAEVEDFDDDVDDDFDDDDDDDFDDDDEEDDEDDEPKQGRRGSRRR